MKCLGLGNIGRMAALTASESCSHIQAEFGLGTTVSIKLTTKGGVILDVSQNQFPSGTSALDYALDRVLSADSSADMNELFSDTGILLIIGLMDEIDANEVHAITQISAERGILSIGIIIPQLFNLSEDVRTRWAQSVTMFDVYHVIPNYKLRTARIDPSRVDVLQASCASVLLLTTLSFCEFLISESWINNGRLRL